MKIKRLELTSFRNYKNLNIDLDDKTNIFYGNNAQGKTNILEGIYLSCTTKSHKKSKDREMIRFGDDEAHLRVIIEKKDIDYKIDMHLRKSEKKHIAINSIPIKKASELLGIANIIFFSPEDMNIIKNGPSERRRFVDMELSQLDKIYLSLIGNYTKALEQKNKLLKDALYFRDPSFKDMLDVWDEKLSEYGSEIIKKRQAFIEELNEILVKKNKEITGIDEELSCIYEPDTPVNEYREKLKESRETDIKNGNTSTGPHRDDIKIALNGVDLRKYGSQGQQRSASLSLKLSEIELVKKRINDLPILLLDDVLSELDSNRQKCLLNSIGDIQTLITCTGLDEFVKNRFVTDCVFFVENATVTKKQSKKE